MKRFHDAISHLAIEVTVHKKTVGRFEVAPPHRSIFKNTREKVVAKGVAIPHHDPLTPTRSDKRGLTTRTTLAGTQCID